MKRMLVAAILVAAVAIMAFGALGTGAWFSDSATVAGNTLAAGKLQIELRDGNAAPIAVNVQNMAPGDDYKPVGGTFELAAYNNGTEPNPASTLPLKYKMSFTDVVPSGAADLRNVLMVKVMGWFPGMGTPFIQVFEGTWNEFVIYSTLNDIVNNYNGGILDVQNTHEYQLQFKIASSAGNEYQGAALNFTMLIEAFQVADPIF